MVNLRKHLSLFATVLAGIGRLPQQHAVPRGGSLTDQEERLRPARPVAKAALAALLLAALLGPFSAAAQVVQKRGTVVRIGPVAQSQVAQAPEPRSSVLKDLAPTLLPLTYSLMTGQPYSLPLFSGFQQGPSQQVVPGSPVDIYARMQSVSLADLQYAAALAENAKDAGAPARKQCWDAWIHVIGPQSMATNVINSGQAGVVSRFEQMSQVAQQLQPVSQLNVACAPAAAAMGLQPQQFYTMVLGGMAFNAVR